MGRKLDHGGGLDTIRGPFCGLQAGAAGRKIAIAYGAVHTARDRHAGDSGTGQSAYAGKRISKPNGAATVGPIEHGGVDACQEMRYNQNARCARCQAEREPIGPTDRTNHGRAVHCDIMAEGMGPWEKTSALGGERARIT